MKWLLLQVDHLLPDIGRTMVELTYTYGLCSVSPSVIKIDADSSSDPAESIESNEEVVLKIDRAFEVSENRAVGSIWL